VLLMGCALRGTSANSTYDPATDARIRVYFGVSTHFYFNTECEPKHGSIGHGGGSTEVAKPRVLHLANTTIGMPLPQDAYKYYDEYVIKANQPLTITLDSGGWSQNNGFVVTETRRHAAGTFAPQAGVDYEAFAQDEHGYLRLAVRRLRVEDQSVQVEMLNIKGAPQCQ